MDEELLEWLNRHPQLRRRIVALLDVAEASSFELPRAEDAQDLVTEEFRRMGQQTLQACAER